MTYFSLYYSWSTLGYNTVEYPTIDKQEEDVPPEEVTCATEPSELHIFIDEIESSDDDDESEPLCVKKKGEKSANATNDTLYVSNVLNNKG
jgi:hypothetical protein